ncbi:histone H3-lysine(4) N-trimethyltransferase ATX1-like isoform X1 [Coffea arabica]|uniref:Histone H3-lysine(4) N-trimethyltransferase ATX1-like isoform X1 n=1 Tax=Coffea arabica TaxID=13443 RepID=A0A6P6WNY4_COFAR|nr:histone-lysine N-methyltransferase ATX2-like [Coffea arabica]XP_027117146.1 histone-lysine N-methyltransferase ATX2-like [Coffea arabica]XP_027117147.1 histone-lysine N-methyltransferase ATX2-like [Coffea arabica]XP_027117148.1 histone-lysine N-methyltransferase ATX2-like [Coffea arabica]
MAFPSTALIRFDNNEAGKEEGKELETENEPVELLNLGDHEPLQGRKGSEIEIAGAEEEEDGGNTPLRYVPLCDVYSATSPCVSSASGGSKKVKPPRKSMSHFNGHDPAAKPPHQILSSMEGVRGGDGSDNSRVNVAGDGKGKPPITKVYTRRNKGKRKEREDGWQNSRSRGVNLGNSKEKGEENEGIEVENGELIAKKGKRRKVGGYELANLGLDSIALSTLDRLQLRESRHGNDVNSGNRSRNPSVQVSPNKIRKRKPKGEMGDEIRDFGALRTKRWVWLSFDGTDPYKFVGLLCKVFWPLDADWYKGRVVAYDLEMGRHSVEYEDGDEEKLILSNERIKFHISPEEMQRLKLRASDKCLEGDAIDVNEMVVLAASLDDCEELEPADIIWAKLTGHAMWPALVLDGSLFGEHKGLNRNSGEKSVLVQFFGTHDFARVKRKQVMSFLRGLLSSFHLKCKKPNFVRSLEEAKMYLSAQKLPKRMVRLRNGFEANAYNVESGEDEGSDDSGKEGKADEDIQRRIEAVKSFPFEVGDLQIITLGKVVRDWENIQDERYIWPEGYTALRRFPSITEPNVHTTYKMEVLRDDGLRNRPLFRVTSENGEQFSGTTPSACWNKIYRRMRKIQSEGLQPSVSEKFCESGADMFGFSHPEISKLIQELSTSSSRMPSKASKIARARYQDFPVGYRPVDVKWKDLDKCNVCHMDEEYENNLFLQCDKCRIMVHARCYGELEPLDGVLWLCNLCRPGAPEQPPPCCLCPVTGGAMKPTTDGRWAHLACAIWIPETCLSDITKMEPIDGLSRINKDRWKLLCSICGVSYGACIQCSNHNCRVAYHPLCARAAGFCLELEDEDRLNLAPPDEEDDDQCIRLLSFCKRHSPLSSERLATEDRTAQKPFKFSDYTPPLNTSGCARTEPYNYFGRRGRKEPEALAAASLKRLYVENRPHLVGGFSQHTSFGNDVSSSSAAGSRFSLDLLNLKSSQLDASGSILSMAEKYTYMRETFRKRLVFGKSRIHGFGIFAKQPYRAGDMVIEYIGELVRPSIADRREHLIYNSLVGAGTYMFRIDDERVIDATRAGSIAHLINHSCEPNCYSRVISVNGDEHIIIFAKRDIKQWEELTYDYRFFAKDEQLACYCGFPRCRGVVNDTEAEERASKLYAPRGELVDWKGE